LSLYHHQSRTCLSWNYLPLRIGRKIREKQILTEDFPIVGLKSSVIKSRFVAVLLLSLFFEGRQVIKCSCQRNYNGSFRLLSHDRRTMRRDTRHCPSWFSTFDFRLRILVEAFLLLRRKSSVRKREQANSACSRSALVSSVRDCLASWRKFTRLHSDFRLFF